MVAGNSLRSRGRTVRGSWLSSEFRVLGRKNAPFVLVALAERGGMHHKQITKELTDASSQTTEVLHGLESAGLASKRPDETWVATPRGRLLADHCREILGACPGQALGASAAR